MLTALGWTLQAKVVLSSLADAPAVALGFSKQRLVVFVSVTWTWVRHCTPNERLGQSRSARQHLFTSSLTLKLSREASAKGYREGSRPWIRVVRCNPWGTNLVVTPRDRKGRNREHHP